VRPDILFLMARGKVAPTDLTPREKAYFKEEYGGFLKEYCHENVEDITSGKKALTRDEADNIVLNEKSRILNEFDDKKLNNPIVLLFGTLMTCFTAGGMSSVLCPPAMPALFLGTLAVGVGLGILRSVKWNAMEEKLASYNTDRRGGWGLVSENSPVKHVWEKEGTAGWELVS
jgi:hypothetical protein